ncbi:OLC1v1019023C1 [Oldenlandia corymbosa var. corymbosa]|uniref:OLC1v1019023C1 n=1 Tax=Oldenlandia corymbosa var. corymbosa TaxID=529605 RepID=A0AAV1ED37_OLDCO|nr:OLC1v1019023C1 [Oldenlandia corymbosa var. corymbosa]
MISVKTPRIEHYNASYTISQEMQYGHHNGSHLVYSMSRPGSRSIKFEMENLDEPSEHYDQIDGEITTHNTFPAANVRYPTTPPSINIMSVEGKKQEEILACQTCGVNYHSTNNNTITAKEDFLLSNQYCCECQKMITSATASKHHSVEHDDEEPSSCCCL